MLAGDGEKLVKKRYAQYGSVFSTWILGKRTIFIGSVDLMKWLLNKEHDIVEGALRISLAVLLTGNNNRPDVTLWVITIRRWGA